MSAFGGDSWAREAQHRKQRVYDLMLSTAPTRGSSGSYKKLSNGAAQYRKQRVDHMPPAPPSGGNSNSYKKLSNGKYACLVCPHHPILDTPLMISMHNKGTRHIAAESRLKEREISIQEEISKRKALSAWSTVSGTSNDGLKRSKVQDKPLIENTQIAILEAQSKRAENLTARLDKPSTTTSSCYPEFSFNLSRTIKTPQNGMVDQPSCSWKSAMTTKVVDEILANKNAELRKCQEKELKFTAAGWKRDGYGKWYKDENAEFDSDEEDPNLCLD